MPMLVGMIHGIAMPIAKHTDATTTGTLRRPMKSENGPAATEPTRPTTIVIVDITEIVTAESSVDWPT